MNEWIEKISKWVCERELNFITELIDDLLPEYKNEQWFLDFLDGLNKQSVRG